MSTDVTDITALRAATTNYAVVNLEGYHTAGDQGGGTFIYDAADTSSPDDGAVVVVNSIGGRFKRQWSGWFDFRWAGAVGDGSTDNANAWSSISYIGRAASTAGRGFNLLIPPGTYNFNMQTCGYYFLAGIKDLRISGYGATIQNTYTGTNGNWQRPWSLTTATLWNNSGGTIVGVPNGSTNPLSWLVQSTAVGDTQITMTTPGDAAAWAVGDPILITSLDLQYLGGYPPNPDQFEYHTVTSVNTTTGVVQIDGTIGYQHLSTFPDGGNTPYPVGKARAWKLSAPFIVPNPLNPTTNYTITLPWDINHIYEGLKINDCPANTTPYMTTSGKNVQFIDCTTIGISPTVADTVIYKNHVITKVSEPDKMVTHLVLDNVTCLTSGVGFQSSSINNVTIDGGRFAGLNVGTAKYVDIRNAEIDSLSFNNTYGTCRSTNITGGVVRSVSGPASAISGTPQRTIDGTNVTYANGVITVPKAGTYRSHWGLTPGMTLNLATSGGGFSGDTGTGIVTSMTEDATNVYVGVTWPFASLPSWAGTGVRVFNTGSVRCSAVYGSDTIRNLSGATLHGVKPWEYCHAQFANFQQTSGVLYDFAGAVTKIVANVRQPSSLSAARFVLNISMITDDLLNDPKTVTLTINANLRGKRVISQTSFDGKLTSDNLQLVSTPITTLPTGRLSTIGASWGLGGVTLPGSTDQVPMIDLEIFLDGGLYGDTLVRKVDGFGSGVTCVTGLLP